MLAPWKKSYYKPRQHIKKQMHHFAGKGPNSQTYGFIHIWLLSHVWIWVGPYRRLNAKELMLSNCVVEKTLEIPLDCKKIKPVNPKGNQPWIFIGRTDAKAEASILWPPDVKSQLIGRDPDNGKDQRQMKRGWQRMLRLDSIMDSMDMNLNKLWETVTDREAWQTIVHGVTKSQTWLSDWTTTIAAYQRE